MATPTSPASAPTTTTATSTSAATPVADLVYRNGSVHTIDAAARVVQALAVRAGRIVYVGDDAGAARWTGKATRVVDLHGRMLMPGLIDAHMHPQSGGSRMLNCSLDYLSLTVAQFQARIQACLDAAPASEKAGDRPLLVVNWFEQGMVPDGVATSRATLDALATGRAVIVRSSFGHSVLLNSRALALAGIGPATADPVAGKIVRDSAGAATGLLEDAAQDPAMAMLPPLTVAQNLAASTQALAAMRVQGITSFLDAWTDPETLTAFATLQRQGRLTARAHFAVLIDLDKGASPASAVAALLRERRRYDQGPTKVAPTMQVRHAKLFMDGVIAAPAFTGAMLEPYLENVGAPSQSDWQPGANRGPAPYFSAQALGATLAALATARIDPHIHADGDGAVRASLDAIATVRGSAAGKLLRPALAHAELVDPEDFGRFAQLDVTPVLSFQWAKPAADTVGALRDYLGPVRYANVEPQALLADAGARLAYGSDWPVDPLDPWYALQVAVTRSAGAQAGKDYGGRLTAQNSLSRAQALRAATMGAAWTLRQEKQTGSLEVGKLADFIILDRHFFTVPDDQIATIKVLQTVVGGKLVHGAPALDGVPAR